MAKEHDSSEWAKARAHAKTVLPPQCTSCGKHLEGNDWTIDHIIPVNAGGTHDLHNLQSMCRSCNGAKQDKVFERANWLNKRWF
jgi:5-methylcytosine-specific restriction endonuclease McrA